MPTYQRFEDLPAWNAATEVAVEIFRLTEAASFRFKGDLVNQLRRAALSIANNIAVSAVQGTSERPLVQSARKCVMIEPNEEQGVEKRLAF